MSGETDLSVLIRSMEPVLSADRYGYISLPKGREVPAGCTPFAVLSEDEGLMLVAQVEQLAAVGHPSDADWARISLTVHSSLSAVGLTAAFARVLGDAGISANVIAGYYHDHIFVSWTQREAAVAALQALATAGGRNV